MSTALAPSAASGPDQEDGRWYVTATHVRQVYVDGEPVARPASLAHAKRMGTLTTACGEWAYSWQRLLDVPFPVPRLKGVVVEQCGACVDRVIGDW